MAENTSDRCRCSLLGQHRTPLQPCQGTQQRKSRLMARMKPLIVLFLLSGTCFGHTYTTTFPGSENPISERGNWINGGIGGGSSLWGNVRMAPGLAFGVSEPTRFGDPTA